MSSLPLVNNQVYNNIHRVNSTDDNKFSKEYPDMLRGIMTEGEYLGYLERIEEAGQTSSKTIVLNVTMFILFLPLIGLFFSGLFMVGVIYGFCWFVICMFLVVIINKSQRDGHRNAEQGISTAINSINNQLYSRGVKFLYAQGTEGTPRYIDVVLFNPNSTKGTDYSPSTPMSYSSISTSTRPPNKSKSKPTQYPYDMYQSSQPFYSPVPSAPPPDAFSSGYQTDFSMPSGFDGDTSMFSMVV